MHGEEIVMTGTGSRRDNLMWVGAIALSGWLSVRVAHWMADSLATLRPAGTTSAEPVREIVQEVLAEHPDEAGPVAQAFEAALEDEAEEESRV